jgi:hypothetical protein
VANTEIFWGFPECVQGDKPRAKLLFAQILDADPFNDEAAKNMDYLRSV